MAIGASLAMAAEVKVEWLDTVHNFGAFDENDGNVTCEFRFVNVGDEPVMVKAVRTSCGCTTSKPGNKLIQPGDTSTVSATYNPTGRPGKFDKKIYVDMNTNPARSTLKICGTVIGNSNTLRGRFPIEAGPIRLRRDNTSFGEVIKGRVKNEFFEIYNASMDTLTPEWSGLPPYIRAVTKNPSIAPGENLTYALVFDGASGKLDYGLITENIYFSPEEDADPVKVEIVANVVEDFSRMTPKELRSAPSIAVDSRTVDFGSFPREGGTSRQFKITNRGDNTMIIRRVYSAEPGVTVSVDKNKVKKGKDAVVTVTVDPSQLPAEVLDARVSIIVNDPANPTTIVRAVGFPE